jgi:uncharacterized phage protein gp47/JayE
MASPDASSYIDLTVYDMQPIDIYDAAIEYARTAVPEWTPVTGSIEDAIVQSAAYMTGQLLGAINRLPSGNIEGLLRLFGIERNSGTAASATVEIQMIDDFGHTIPARTRCGFSETVGDSTTLYIFESTSDIIVNTGVTSASAVLESVTLAQYPAIAAGQNLQLLSAVSFIDSITLVDDLSIGTDAESTTEFLNRGINKFASLSEALTVPSQFTAYLVDTYTSAYRATTTSRLKKERAVTTLTRSSGTVTAAIGSGHGLSTGDIIRLIGSSDGTFDGIYTLGGASGASVSWSRSGTNNSSGASTETALLSHKLQTAGSNGYVSVYLSDVGGASLSNASIQAIEDDLSDRCVAGLIVRVDNAKVVGVNIAVTITLKSNNVSGQSVETAVQSALDEYVHPDYWQWDDAIYKNEIISLVDQVSGVGRVVSVTLTSDNATYIQESGGDLLFLKKGVLPLNSSVISVQ